MKLFITITLLLSLAFSAQGDPAQKASLGFVASYDSHSEDKTPEDLSGDNRDSAFKAGYARLNFKGKFNDKVGYRLRFRLNKDSGTTKDDGLDSSVDYAWVEHQLGPGKIRIGKQANQVCVFEQKWGSYRRYHLSAACAAGDKFKYNIGASYWYKFGNNKFGIGIGNRSNSFEKKETGLAMNLSYSGNFLDGVLQPMLTYSSFSHGSQDSDGDGVEDAISGTDTNIGLGIRFKFYGIVSEIEHISFTDANLSTTAGKDSKTNSINLNFRYTVAQWTPFFKLESSQAEEDTDSVYINGSSGGGLSSHDKKIGVSVGFEFKPWADTHLEYFVYHQVDDYTDETSGSSVVAIKDSVTRVGFRTNISIL